MDRYESFKELKKHEHRYSINRLDRGSPITILAPHGGNIEPHTSEIARLIAAENYNLFCFNGQKQCDNHTLHITSHNYDEEQALTLVCSSSIVIAVHGCVQKSAMIFIGGRWEILKQHIAHHVHRMELPAVICDETSGFSGQHPDNICNRGLNGGGIQLEITRPLRDSPRAWSLIAAAVREALATFDNC